MQHKQYLLSSFTLLISLQLCFAQRGGEDAGRNRGYSREAFCTDSEVLDNIHKLAAAAREEQWDSPSRDSYTDYYPGSIPITEDVSPSGARVYSVPIQTAAGWKLVPSIALTYNSQGGNGVAGYGWDIAGIPCIRIRGKNYYYDGVFEDSIFDTTDAAYSLDGMPIVQSEGTVSGYHYTTSRGNIQVKPYLSASGTVSLFTALYPNGTVATFSLPDDSSANNLYPLTELSDKDGNSISFSYYTLFNNHYLTRIDYGVDSSIEFTYNNTRFDLPVYYYFRGGRHCPYPYRLLKSITSMDGADTLCHYTLTHVIDDEVSFLKEIHCSSGSEELPPITFTYDIEDNEVGSLTSFEAVDSCFFQSFFTKTDSLNVIYKRGRLVSGAATDAIVSFPEHDIYTKIDSTTFFFRKYYKYGSAYSPNQHILCNLTGYISTIQQTILAESGFQTIEAMDVDGDGIDELVKVNSSSTTAGITDYKITIYSFDFSGAMTSSSFTVSANDGTSNRYYTNPAKSFYKFGDFRGDGRPMLLIMTRDASRFALVDLNGGSKVSEGSLFTMSDEESLRIVAADFENDGQEDLCHVTDTGMDVYSLSPLSGTSFSLRTTYSGANVTSLCADQSYTYNGTHPTVPCHIEAVDLTGDGYKEIVSYPLPYVIDNLHIRSSTLNIGYFNGKSFQTVSRTLLERNNDETLVFLDADKDGLADILQLHNSRLYLIPNVSGDFQYPSIYTDVSLDSTSVLVPVSMSGFREYGDILVFSGPKVMAYKYGTDHEANRRIVRVQDSSGLVHESLYRSIMTDDGAYLEDTYRTYSSDNGFKRVRIPLTVLFGERVWMAADLIRNEYYTYWDAVINSRGLGFCGFGRIRAIDYIDSDYRCSVFDPERFGVETQTTVSKSANGTPYSTVTNTYDNHTTTYGKLNPRLTGSEGTDNLTGITTTTSVTYDSYDYPTRIVTRRRIGSGEAKTESITRTYQHSTSSSAYVLGVITEDMLVKEGDGVSESNWKEKSVYTYDSSFRPLTRKDYVGNAGRDPHPPIIDDDSLILRLPPIGPDTNFLVGETRWQYDSHGNVVSERTAPYEATVFTGTSCIYDGSGRYPVSTTDELGHTTTYGTYNKFGKPASVTDYRGRTTYYTYDSWGNLERTAYPDGGVDSTLTQWGGSKLYTVTRKATGKPTTQTHFDALGREVCRGVKRFDGQWQWVDTYYGIDGRISQTSLPYRGSSASYWNTYSYDIYGRPTSVVEPSGKVTTWSYSGTSTTTVKDGITSTSTTDAAGNVVGVTDGGGTITYTLRDDGQPAEINSGGVTITLTYDDYGRRTCISDPGAGTYTDAYQWNSDGTSQTIHTGPNGTTVTCRDSLGRTTSVSRAGEFSTAYTYDGYGRLSAETSTNGTMTEYTYDSMDRVATRKDYGPDGKWLNRAYTYGTGSVLSSIAYTSQSGPITTESFTYVNGWNSGVLAAGTTVFHLLSENDLGQTTEISTGNISREYGFSAYGLPTYRRMSCGGTIQNFTYQFDAGTGNLLSRQDQKHSTGETFGYDSLNRLTAIGSRQISYADNGNITSIGGVGSLSYGDATNPYLTTSLLPESGGPGLLIPQQTVSHNSFDRPASISENGTTAQITYNASGERVKMTVASGTDTLLTRYYIGGRYECEQTPGGVKERLYLGGDAYSAPMVYQKDSLNGVWTVYNIGRDYLGNITHVVTGSGTLVAEYSYDPWGRLRDPQTLAIYAPGQEPVLFLGRGFTGHEHLPWFGLINMNARLYDPLVGRFLSPDPFVQAPDFTQNYNRYSYALNNPLKYTDESGEIWFITRRLSSNEIHLGISNGYFGFGLVVTWDKELWVGGYIEGGLRIQNGLYSFAANLEVKSQYGTKSQDVKTSLSVNLEADFGVVSASASISYSFLNDDFKHGTLSSGISVTSPWGKHFGPSVGYTWKHDFNTDETTRMVYAGISYKTTDYDSSNTYPWAFKGSASVGYTFREQKEGESWKDLISFNLSFDYSSGQSKRNIDSSYNKYANPGWKVKPMKSSTTIPFMSLYNSAVMYSLNNLYGEWWKTDDDESARNNVNNTFKP